MAKRIESKDRTDLGNEWAAAVAELDDLRDRLVHAEKRERETWDALQRSRSLSVRAPSPSPTGPGGEP